MSQFLFKVNSKTLEQWIWKLFLTFSKYLSQIKEVRILMLTNPDVSNVTKLVINMLEERPCCSIVFIVDIEQIFSHKAAYESVSSSNINWLEIKRNRPIFFREQNRYLLVCFEINSSLKICCTLDYERDNRKLCTWKSL